jgi:hypothetical protein
MWFIEKYLVLKLLNKHTKETRYKLRLLVNEYLIYQRDKTLTISSFYRLARELEDKGFIELIPTLVPTTQKKQGYWISGSKKIEYCHLTNTGRAELYSLKQIITRMVKQ